MANNPISMSKTRQILRLHSQGRSKLLMANQTGVARNTIKKYLKEFEQSGLSFTEINELSDKDLEDLQRPALRGEEGAGGAPVRDRRR